MTATATARPAPRSADDLLVATHCTKRFGGLVAVSDVNFTIPREAIVSLIGPNGAGKTTFFNMITGLYIPTEGSIKFDGNELTGRKPHEVVRLGVARTFQNIRLFGNMSAEENVLVGMHHRLKGRWFQAILRPPSIERNFGNILNEYAAVRNATIELLKSFTEEMFYFKGTAGHSTMSVRAVGYLILGHEIHHVQTIKDRYLNR